MLNKQTIIGHLGRDPEMHYTPSGQAVCNFSVASTKSWTDKNGERHKQTTWTRVSTWGNMAENCSKYLVKGSLVYIEGSPVADENGNPRTWSKNDGSVGTSFEVRAQIVLFLSKRETGETEQVAMSDVTEEDDFPF
jgi:single-strand DNA-binding protein